MAATFFFYDLETSGFSPHAARIMQFAGQRTDSNLQPIGDPVNVLIKLAPDVLPDPDAIMLTGITPQSTITDGLTEAEFLRFFYDEVVQPDTTFLGYNTVRFDDEFMRYLHYRNFYDPYEWQWLDGCSRWDVLDLVRMTRALRPDGITWPVTDEGKPTNRLELLTKANGLDHDHAHDALSDVWATIAMAKLIRDKQPDLFSYLYEHRNKKRVAELILQGQPLVYTTGRYPSATWHTSAAVLLSKHPQQDSALVFDLRYDPTVFAEMSVEQLVAAWRYKKDRSVDEPRLPVKTLKYNRCPAVAPLGVIKDEAVQQRLELSLADVTKHLEALRSVHQNLARKVLGALTILDDERARASSLQTPNDTSVDGLLYNGFFAGNDKQTMRAIRAAEPGELASFSAKLTDARLQAMLPLYKARNYPNSLDSEERQQWEQHLVRQLFGDGAHNPMQQYFSRLQALAAGTLTSEQTYILEELQLYGQSIMPADSSNQD